MENDTNSEWVDAGNWIDVGQWGIFLKHLYTHPRNKIKAAEVDNMKQLLIFTHALRHPFRRLGRKRANHLLSRTY